MTDCIFCKIAAGEISADVVFQNELVTAFSDLNPQAPTHILIIPNKHIDGLDALEDEESVAAAAECLRAASQIARDKNVSDGYRVVTNIGTHGGQSVRHLHFHLLAGRQMGRLG